MSSPGRTVTTTEHVPALGSRRAAGTWAGGLLGLYAALLAAAGGPAPWVFVAVAGLLVAVEELLPTRAAAVSWGLGRTGAGPPLRGVLRGLALLLLAARSGHSALPVATAAWVALTTGLHLARHGLAQLVTYLRTPPLLSRNLDLGPVRIPPAPHPRLLAPAGLAAATDLPAAVGLALAAGGAGPAAGVAGLAGSLLLAAVAPVLLGVAALRLHRGRVRSRVAEQVQRALRADPAQLLLYFAGTPATLYQVEMWLEPVEQLRRPALVVLRDRDALAALAPTRLPVVCAPYGSTLMALDLPAARIALYPANAAGNIHLLRRRGLRSVFVGHGDSDKAASSSPFSRVYDEIWVAGPAGRDRYAEAGVGVDPAAIVEVGRPQLPAALAAPPGPGPVTVLYAPTWEGWGEDPRHTSLTTLGPDLVAALLSTPGVRVLYRPHPLTGTRDPAAARAHARVLALLRAAGAAGPEMVREPPPTAAGPGAAASDLLDLAARSGRGTGWSREEHRARQQAWVSAYWGAVEPGRHRIVTAPAPDLFSCFGRSAALVADVSSVVSDWLATGRPYAVPNLGPLPEADFRAAFASAAGAVVLGPDLAGLDTLVTAAAGGPDPLAAARAATRRRLLGPTDAEPLAPFRAAVDGLYRRPEPVRASRPDPAGVLSA